MQALLVTPGTANSARIAEIDDVRPAPGEVLLRTLEVGVCGTDSEIAHGLFGTAPAGEEHLVLGHELLGEVVTGAGGFSAGDLVAATVRRSCGQCTACAEGSPDACLTGRYLERGITSLHGFASELAVESPDHLVPIPAELGRFGVLAEPASVTARAIRHARAIGSRQVWEPRRALVIGAGAIGTLATHFLRLDGLEVWTASREPEDSAQAEVIRPSGARYVSTTATPLEELRAEVGGFDLVFEAAGDAAVAALGLSLLGRNGVACLLGLDARPGTIGLERRTLTVETVIENRALFGSVNAHPADWHDAVRRLAAIRRDLPEAAERMVALRVSPDRFGDAFGFRGGKATLRFA